MALRKFLVVYTTALIIAAIVAFLRYLHPPEGPSDGGAAQVACCPWGEKQPTQTAILRVPRAMQNGATDLVVIVSDLRAPIESLRIIGNQLLEKPDSWATVRLPLADHLAIHPISQVYGVVPIQPEERSGFLRSKRPLVWSWEIRPTRPGRFRLFLVGDAWLKSKWFWFTLPPQKIHVHEPLLQSLKSFFGTIPDWLKVILALPLTGWIGDWWGRRRRSSRPAGFGR